MSFTQLWKLNSLSIFAYDSRIGFSVDFNFALQGRRLQDSQVLSDKKLARSCLQQRMGGQQPENCFWTESDKKFSASLWEHIQKLIAWIYTKPVVDLQAPALMYYSYLQSRSLRRNPATTTKGTKERNHWCGLWVILKLFP